MGWSRLLHDFMLGAALGDKESEDWVLAMLGPRLEGEGGEPGAGAQLAPGPAVAPSPAYEGEPIAVPVEPMAPGRPPAVSPPIQMRPAEPGRVDTVPGMAQTAGGVGAGGYGMQLLSAPPGGRGGGYGRGRQGMRRRGGPPQRGADRRGPEPGMGGGRGTGQASDGDDRAWWSPGYVLRDSVTPGGTATVAWRTNVPLLEWCAPAQPVDAELYNAYLNTHGRAQYKPGGERKRWHEFTDPFHGRVAWYVWHGIPQAEAEVRASQMDVHMREFLATHPWTKLAQGTTMFEPTDLDWMLQPPAPGEQEARLRPVGQRHEDLLRIEHAIESLGKLVESGHPEYLPYYLVARETPIKIVSWAGVGADAQTNPFYDCVYLGRGVVRNQADLVTQIVHEIQHVYDWHWQVNIPVPLHDWEERATPLETAAGQDYIDLVFAGEISEDGLPPEARQPVAPKRQKPES